MSKNSNNTNNNNSQEEVKMENNNYYDENGQQNNDQQQDSAPEATPENNEGQQQSNQAPAVQAKEKNGIVKNAGIFLAGVATGVIGTCAFFAVRGKKAPKIDSAIADNVINFTTEAIKEAVNK